jgi:hypothetical protein
MIIFRESFSRQYYSQVHDNEHKLSFGNVLAEFPIINILPRYEGLKFWSTGQSVAIYVIHSQIST